MIWGYEVLFPYSSGLVPNLICEKLSGSCGGGGVPGHKDPNIRVAL